MSTRDVRDSEKISFQYRIDFIPSSDFFLSMWIQIQFKSMLFQKHKLKKYKRKNEIYRLFI